ncbi:MAG: RNA polymerase sigma factor [Bacteroidia bacterium]|nr:RNA polymerase sigma factor [Bacteroidia bacterium]
MPIDLPHIIDGCRKGDKMSQRRFYEHFSPKMLAVCHRYARQEGDAHDMLQDAFIKVFQNFSKYDDRGSVEGWVRRVVVNTAIDHLRKHKYQLQQTEVNEAIHETTNAEDALDHMELSFLYDVIQSLPEGYRMIFNLYAIEGFSHAEIGEKLGINESTSRSQYTRARSQLKKRIEQVYMEEKIYKDVI